MTIGAKLAVGFGILAMLLAASAGAALYHLARVQRGIDVVLDQAVPTMRSCDLLLGDLNQASAALRGYLATTSDSKTAAAFRADGDDAWKEVDAELTNLTSYLEAIEDMGASRRVAELVTLVERQRQDHQQILELAHTAENLPVLYILQHDTAPKIVQSLDLLDQIISDEMALEATAESKQLLVAMGAARTSYARVLVELTAYVSQGDAASLQVLEARWQDCATSMQSAGHSADHLTSSQKKTWEQLSATHGELESLKNKLIQRRGADDWNLAEHAWLTKTSPRGRQIRALLDQITSELETWRIEEKARLMASSRSAIVAPAAMLVSVLVSAAIAILLTRRIVATIRALADRARQISEGELRGEALVTKGADELGQLADGFNVMLANLRDLTGQIFSVTENVNSAAAQISSSANQQAAGAKEQAATVQEVTSTMQEISQSGAQIVAKAREVAAVAEQASTASRSGMDAVQGANRAMEAIREQVEEVAENIVSLSEKTQAVGEIISTVNEIAEQSNLLALNATIEAADAGDEGNRFSVVAAEMKNLADQAKECTVHVRKILGEIQKGINTSVMLTEEAVKRVESGKQQADVSENVIRQISSTTEETIAAFQQIIGATNQQQVGLEQVARGMQDIDQSAQQAAVGTGQLEQAVVNLSAMSKQLRTAVASYKV